MGINEMIGLRYEYDYAHMCIIDNKTGLDLCDEKIANELNRQHNIIEHQKSTINKLADNDTKKLLKDNDDIQVSLEALLVEYYKLQEKLERADLMLEKRDELIDKTLKELYLKQDSHELSYNDYVEQMKQSIK